MGRTRKPLPEKFCEQCGQELIRKMYGTYLEDAGRFNLRRFCNRQCSLTWLHNRERSRKLPAQRKAAVKYRGPSCEACGSATSLASHHVDQNPANNEPGNLQTLCSFCHNFLHSAASRQGVEIAGRMPPLMQFLTSCDVSSLPHGQPFAASSSLIGRLPD